MNEQYQKLIEKAGFHISKPMVVGYVWCSDEYPIDEELINLINVVCSYERDACAKVVIDIAKDESSIALVLEAVADAIRARGNT
jgi:hypothetical protein